MVQDYGTGDNLTVRLAGPYGGNGTGGISVKLTEIVLLASNWKGGESPYFQVVDVDGVSINSMVNLHPSVEQPELWYTAFYAENDAGVVTVYAVGDKPKNDYTIQASITEVIA